MDPAEAPAPAPALPGDAQAPDATTFRGTWPAEPANVPVARRATVAALADAGIEQAVLDDVALAVSEAVTNAVVHAYAGREPGELRIVAEHDDELVTIRVEDDGDGVVPRPDTPGLGLGLPLIATLAEHFDVASRDGSGTTVTIVLRRP